MASDEDDDLEALRQAALATLKKKSAVVEEAQPIPQLTSSGHSLQGSNSSPWADDFVPDTVPFHDNQAVTQFQDSAWGQQFHQPPYGQGSPTRYNVNNWRGGRASYHKPFQRGRGAFPIHNPRLPFSAAQPPRLPFNRNQNAFVPGGPPSLGGGNLIVINTVPEDGGPPAGPRFQGNRFPFNPRGRGAPMGGPGFGGRGAPFVGIGGRGAQFGGQNNNTGPVPVESSSKPMLLRPQDKYCPDGNSDNSQDASSLHRKKKDKFSRFESSGSESDDESSEDDGDEPGPANSTSASHRDDSMVTENDGGGDADRVLPDAELSISAVNSSHVDSDLEEPVTTVELDDSGRRASDAEVSQEIEDRLLAPSPPAEGSEQSSGPDESVDSRSVAVSVAESIEKVKSPSPSPRTETKANGESGTSSSSSDSDNKSGNESDSESSSSSNPSDANNASSDGESDSGSDEEEAKSENSQSEDNSGRSPSPSQNSADSDAESDGGDQRTAVRRSSSRQSVTKVGAKASSSHPPKTENKPARTLTPEERAKLEARKRKFESGQEVTVSGQSKKISLKGILPKSKKPKQPLQTVTVPVKTAATRPKTTVVSKPVACKPASDTHRKNTRRKALPGSSPFYGNTQRDFSRNGGYRRGYGQPRDRQPQWQSRPRDSLPEVHYSSSDDSEDSRKLISVVVPRSSAGQHPQSKVVSRLGGSRKRQVEEGSPLLDDDAGGVVSKTKQDPSSTGAISVVISSGNSSKRPRSTSSRPSVHQRLGMRKGPEASRSQSRANIKPVSRVQPDSDMDEDSNHTELDQRIQRIKEKNAAILRRQEEVRQDKELYG
ncbi:hypothetical protein BaRGS_00001361 [Batillaria attramentaria]|uniref:Uncharacterized protein n=1 Tax=Batillaria attramentaria TaxID=370345 RepID=A0ABD0M7K1_9CAEN